MFCKQCGNEINDKAVICVKCGAKTGNGIIEKASNNSSKDKSKTLAAILCFFVGGLGIHRYYLGKIGTGFLEFLLCCIGIGFIWVLIDFIMILMGSLKPKEGKYIK